METKICSKCGEEKELYEFHIRKDTKDGFRSDCKLCRKEHYYKNRDKELERLKNFYKKNSQKMKIYAHQYRLNNIIDIRKKDMLRKREVRKNTDNLKKEKESCKRWRLKNPDYEKNYSEKRKKLRKEKYENDPIYKLIQNTRTRISKYLKQQGYKKETRTFDIIGCSPIELKEHIEKQFSDGMSWNNYGFYGWHIDHKIPLNFGKTKDDVYKLCHYTNLQPLWRKDNLEKGKKIIRPCS